MSRPEPHVMELPREVIIGDRTLSIIGDLCVKLGFSSKALVVTGETTVKVAGEFVIASLNNANINSHLVLAEKPTMDEVKKVEEEIKRFKPEVVLGVGGGSKIDLAKLGSSLHNIPFISVPTTASHDGIASPFASVKGLNKPYSVKAQAPIAIIVDMDIIADSPKRLISSGCGDVISKITAVKDWRLANKMVGEYYGEYAASLALMSASLLIRNAKLVSSSREGLRVLMEALISCGVAMSIAGSSRPCSGSEHLFSHALDIIAPKPALHGEQCGVGTIMMAYLHGLNWKLIRNTLKIVGAPTTSKELGIEEEYIVEALVKAPEVRPERFTILSIKRLNHDSAWELAQRTGVI